MTDTDRQDRHASAGARFGIYIALISGAFCLFVLAGLAANYHQSRSVDPLNDRQMLALVEKLQAAQQLRDPQAAADQDQSVRTEIRQRDQAIRYEVFRSQAMFRFGAWMLICGAAVFFLSASYVVAARRTAPKFDPAMRDSNAELSRRRVGSLAVLVFAAMLLGGASYLKLSSQKTIVTVVAPVEYIPPTSAQIAEMMNNWPRLFGPMGTGNISTDKAYPTKWDGESGVGILWKSPIDLPGKNSPIIWGDKVFLASADEKTRRVYCFSMADGKELWRRDCPAVSVLPKPLVLEESTGYAPSTMATDGQRVFAIFPTGDLFCLDAASGQEIWSCGFGPLTNAYAHASSLATWGNLLIVLLDQGGPSSGLSLMKALDVASGQVVWQVKRSVGCSWTTPLIANIDGVECVVAASWPLLTANKLQDGKELWSLECLGDDIAPSPTSDGKMIFAGVNTGPGTLSAVLPKDSGGGKIEPTVTWSSNQSVPDIVTPLAGKGRLWTVGSGGNLICYNSTDGKVIYEKELEFGLYATPILINDHIYIFRREDEALIISSGDSYEVLTVCKLADKVAATPAFVDGKIVVRGESTLYCIGGKDSYVPLSTPTSQPTAISVEATPKSSSAKVAGQHEEGSVTSQAVFVPSSAPASRPTSQNISPDKPVGPTSAVTQDLPAKEKVLTHPAATRPDAPTTRPAAIPASRPVKDDL